MSVYGYASVSTTGQDLEAQLQMLEHEGATVIYREIYGNEYGSAGTEILEDWLNLNFPISV